MGGPAHSSTCCGCTNAGCDVSCLPCGIPTCAKVYFDHYKEDCTSETLNITLSRGTNQCAAGGSTSLTTFNLWAGGFGPGAPGLNNGRFSVHQVGLYCASGETRLGWYMLARDQFGNAWEIFLTWTVLATSCSPLDMYTDTLIGKALRINGYYYSTSVAHGSVNKFWQYCSGYGSGGGCGTMRDVLDNLCNTYNLANISIVAC